MRHRLAVILATTAILLMLVQMPAIAAEGATRNRDEAWVEVIVSWWATLLGGSELDERCTVDPWGGCSEGVTPTPPPQTDGRCLIDPWGCPSEG